MNNKIPLHQLAEAVARLTSVSNESAEIFIKAFFDTLSDSLEKGETVKIKGLGTFTPVKDDEDCVTFSPDNDLADTVNAPFASFQPEELNEGVTAEMLDNIAQAETPAGEAIAESAMMEVTEDAEPEKAEESAETSESKPDSETETEVSIANGAVDPEPEQQPEINTQPETVIEPALKQEAETPKKASRPTPVIKPIEEDPEEYVNPVKRTVTDVTESNSIPEPAEEERENGKSGFGFGLIIGIIIGIALGACAAYFYIDSIMQHRGVGNGVAIEASDDEEADPDEVAALLNEAMALAGEYGDTPTSTTSTSQSETEASEVADTSPTEAAVETAPEPAAPVTPAPAQSQPRKDTIQRGYLITNMAKKYYGNKCFWVYIYQENSSKLGNPNKVQAGIELVIPDASKYGIDANNPESIKKARALEAEILKKYPN